MQTSILADYSVTKEFKEQGYVTTLPTDTKYVSAIKAAYSLAVEFAENVPSDIQRKWTHASGKVKHLVNPHRKHRVFRDLIQSTEVSTLLSQLLPAAPYFVTHSKISYKCQGIEQQWLPHQDSAYKMRSASGITVCIYLEDCDKQNGTLEVVPGSHLQGRLKHELVYLAGEKEPQIRVKDMPSTPAVSVEGKQGTLAAFDLDTIHLSGANLRGGYRCILIFELEKANSHPLEQDGRDAIVVNLSTSEISKPLYLPLQRATLFFLDRVARPAVKKAMYFLHQLFGKNN